MKVTFNISNGRVLPPEEARPQTVSDVRQHRQEIAAYNRMLKLNGKIHKIVDTFHRMDDLDVDPPSGLSKAWDKVRGGTEWGGRDYCKGVGRVVLVAEENDKQLQGHFQYDPERLSVPEKPGELVSGISELQTAKTTCTVKSDDISEYRVLYRVDEETGIETYTLRTETWAHINVSPDSDLYPIRVDFQLQIDNRNQTLTYLDDRALRWNTWELLENGRSPLECEKREGQL